MSLVVRHKKDKLVRLSPRELWPKLYSKDAFQVSCDVRDEAGDQVISSSSPEVIIFDERGEQFASTFINCPLVPGSSPSQVKRSEGNFLLHYNQSQYFTQVTLRSNGSSITLPVNSLTQSKDSNEVIPHRREGATCVCVRALYGPYNNMRQMGKMQKTQENNLRFFVSGQFISFYSAVLGAKMFTFYLLDATDKIKFLLGIMVTSSIKRDLNYKFQESYSRGIQSWGSPSEWWTGPWTPSSSPGRPFGTMALSPCSLTACTPTWQIMSIPT